MTEEFTNLLRLIQGDEAQFELGMQIATNYQTEFQEYFGCTVGQARNLFPLLFLSEWNFEGSILDITTFRCQNKDLTTLPIEIGLLQNLRSFFCAGNQLTTLPTEIGKLNSLAFCNFYQNKLSSFPIEMGQLQNLKSLSCENNLFSDSEKERIKKLLPFNCRIDF